MHRAARLYRAGRSRFAQPDLCAHGTYRVLHAPTVLCVPLHLEPGLVRGHWGVENGLHRTLDVQFREDNCRLRRVRHAFSVIGILSRATLNMVRTLRQNFRPDVSIGLLRNRIGCRPWIPASALS